SSMPCWSRAVCSAASKPARSLPNGLLSITSVFTPLALAFSRPSASALFEMTSEISAGKSGMAAALISAAMLEPRPEIRMATRRFMGLQRQIELAVIDDAMLALGRDYSTELRHRLTGIGEDLHHLVDGIRIDDRDHANAAVESAQHFELGHAALRR